MEEVAGSNPASTTIRLKTCIGCGVEKDDSEFHVQRAKKDGLCSYCKPCNNDRASRWARENPAKVKRNSWINHIKRHGINEEAYKALWDSQAGKCAICLREIDLVLDHDHRCCPGMFSCGRCIRGLLCSPCNIALGLLNEDFETAVNVMKYLRD